MTSLRVLVTGAAGLIGGELCGALAERGHAVVALVHRNTRLVRSDGSLVSVVAGPPEAGRASLRQGDIRAADLGLAGDADPLLADCDVVVHCAADTRLAGHGHAAVNVGGTRNLVALLAAMPSPPGLVHVGTAYVCGTRSGRIAEAPCGAIGTNSYETSKAEAERVVAASGVGAVIARPSIVVGRWHDGAIARFENIYGLIKLVGEGRIRALPVAPGATLDLVPIDHVVGGLVDLVEHFPRARGGIYHLASGHPVPLATLCTTAFPGFHAPSLVSVDTGEPRRRDLLALYAGYLTRDPRFATDNLRTLSGRTAPPTDAAFLRRMVAAATAAGFLRPDPALLEHRSSSFPDAAGESESRPGFRPEHTPDTVAGSGLAMRATE